MDVKTVQSKTSVSFAPQVSSKKQSKYNIRPRLPQLQKRLGRPPGKRNLVPTILATGNIQWDTFGVPWRGPQHRDVWSGSFAVWNTCGLNSCLMAWSLLSMHGGATLPADVSRTSAGQVLLQVLEEVRGERYDAARYIWCTEVMGLAVNQEHDLYSSLENVFLDRIPGLTRMEGSKTTACSRSGCLERVEVLSSRSVVMLNPNDITQTTFDLACSATYENPCSDEVDFIQLPGDTRVESRITEDG
ncbi:hypothetical protein BGZ83_003787, partial [Gryganskiella cystojenkinii]